MLSVLGISFHKYCSTSQEKEAKEMIDAKSKFDEKWGHKQKFDKFDEKWGVKINI